MSTNDSKLFSSVKYFTTGFADPSIESVFKENGALRSYYLTETTTHVICDDFDSNKGELEQAIEIYQTPIVTSQWIKSSLKCNTILPIEPFRSVETNPIDRLFRSLTFANANLNPNDHDKLYALVTYYAGRWVSEIDGQSCTHIICASSLGREEENHHRLQDAYEIQSEKIHLITPDWIIDSLNANHLLDEADYHPDLLKDPNEPMDVDEDELDVETTHQQSTEENTPTKSTGVTHRSQLITKNFFNQADQTTPPPSAEPVQGTNDANPSADFAENSQAKTLVPKRSRARATTSTPRQRHNKVNSAVNNNIHANQNGHSSTIKDSNLSTLPIEEKLIRPSISQQVLNNKTNLPIGRPTGVESLSYELNYFLQDKQELIPSSQCFLGCVFYIDENEYRSTVSESDLTSWRKTLTDHGAIVTDDVNHLHLTHFVCAYRISEIYRQISRRSQIRLVTAHWLNDVLQRKKLFVPNLAIHYPSPYNPNETDQLPLAKYFFTLTGFEGLERARLRYMIRSLGGKYSGELTRWHSHLLARDNGPSEKLKKAIEWSINVVNGLWLSELYLGNTFALKQPLEERYKRLGPLANVDHFSFDQIFVHNFLLPWSQPIRISDEMLNSAIRRHHDQHANSHETTNISFKSIFHYNQPMENSLLRSSNENSFSILLSGFDSINTQHYETIVQSLGGQIAASPHLATHLIMNKFVRTEKFYQSLNYVDFILTQNWLEKSFEAKHFLPIEKSHWLTIEESNEKKEISLQESIEKRRQRGNRLLFADLTFFITPSVRPSIGIVQSMIFSAGGRVQRQFPSIKQLTTINERSQLPHCLILSCETDKILLKDVSQSMKILSMDFILQSLVQQEILNIHSFTLKI